MKARILIVVACMSLLAGAALAHGGEEHVIGTAAKISATSITVKTTAGKLVTVGVAPESKFIKNKAGAALADLKVGNRVVIHAKEPEEGTLVADTVEFSSARAAASAGTSAK